eukprot:600395-Pelagomonas_calceolata.AAC.1
MEDGEDTEFASLLHDSKTMHVPVMRHCKTPYMSWMPRPKDAGNTTTICVPLSQGNGNPKEFKHASSARLCFSCTAL